MTTLVERLRAVLCRENCYLVRLDAADEIERLQGELKREKEANDMIAAERDAYQTALARLHAANEKLDADAAFLHKRRGELVIERDRYKAALGTDKDTKGRDVMLAAMLAEIETLRAANAEIARLRDALARLEATVLELESSKALIEYPVAIRLANALKQARAALAADRG